MKYKLFNKFNNKNLFLIIILLASIFSLIYTLLPNSQYWDEGVYITNGKHVFSGGEIGVYERFRPPMLGLVTGLFWKLGLNTILFSKLFILICFISSLYFIYKISEKIFPNSGLLSLLFLLSSNLLLFYTNKILTGIPSICFSLISLYFFIKKKNYLSGLFLGIAFLFRFTAGMLLLAYILYYILKCLKNKKTIKTNLKYFIFLLLGFFTLIIPYFIINHIFFGSAIEPMLSAQGILKASSYDLKNSGILFFSSVLISQNLIFLFFLIFIILLFYVKKLRSLKIILSFIIGLLYFLYFSLLPHREARYILIATPYFCIVSSITITYITSFKLKLKKYYKVVVFVLLIIFLISSVSILKVQTYNEITSPEKEYFNYFSDKNNSIILIDDPVFGIYYNGRFDYLVNTYYANKNLESHKGKYDYIAFSKRFLNCDIDDINCNKELSEFNLKLEKNWKLINTFYFFNEDHFIYKLNS